ncbi:hypothetical protein [Streptomyces cinereospinus]|uniref:Uncharacterized protein n=1 Tax=Streptomyces cinereospinus TaxID=285561 RepID=A0ABV5MYT7_9ACTN
MQGPERAPASWCSRTTPGATGSRSVRALRDHLPHRHRPLYRLASTRARAEAAATAGYAVPLGWATAARADGGPTCSTVRRDPAGRPQGTGVGLAAAEHLNAFQTAFEGRLTPSNN